MKYKFFIFFLLIFTSPFILFADGTAGENAKYETKFIIDMPTAGMLDKNSFSISTNIIKNGTMTIDLIACPYEFVEFGLAYAFNQLIGSSTIKFQGIPGFDLKFRTINETKTFPAIAIGFRSQGSGEYIEKANRFETYSPGLFLVCSKNFKWNLGFVALHGGLNYSFEPSENERSPNFYLGVEQTLGKIISINMEYNANLDEKSNRGLMNMALKAGLSSGITIDFQLRDLFSRQSSNGLNRAISLEFINHF